MSIHLIQNRVKLLQNSSNIQLLDKGFSPDKKYLFTYDKKLYVLRISDRNTYEKKREEFHILQDLHNYGVLSHQPIDIGVLNDLGICYTIYTYLHGEDGNAVISTLSEREQYSLGEKAGKEMAKMHLYQAPRSVDTWFERAINKHDRYVEAYKGCGKKVKYDERIIEFIEKNKQYLSDRPNRFQHDDFHLGNIIVKNKEYAGVIDFNNYDWGDPYHDFVKIALITRGTSIPFSIGQIKGYFNNQIPENFWMLYSIYAAMIVFSTVVWCIKHSPEQTDAMINRLHVLIEDHKQFELLKPTWFVD